MSALKSIRRTTDNVPWQAPTTIGLSLAVGALLAVGHHLFYNSLHGQQAKADGWQILGSDVSPQQLNIAIGTAIAYLVKTFLLLALSTTYIQLLWRALLRAARGSTLSNLDTAFSGLTNVISLSKLCVWWRLPLFFCLALLAWLLPLAAVVAPATLSIETAEILPMPSMLEPVLSLAFESLNFADDMPPVPDGVDPQTLRFAYTIPSREVIEVVKAVAATGSILPVPPPSPNANWALDFPSPVLQCSNISETLSSEIRSNVAASMKSSSECTAYGYLAWLEGMPFSNTSKDDTPVDGDYAFNSRIFEGTSMPAALHIAADPEAMAMVDWGSPPAACDQPAEALYNTSAGAVMMKCELRSADHHTAFNYTNGLQSVSVSIASPGNATLQTIVGFNCSTSDGGDASCDITSEAMRILSYQAIMDAVTYLITAYISTNRNSTSPFISTQVISTALISTPELDFLTKPILQHESSTGARTLQQNFLSWASTRDQGMVRTAGREQTKDLAQTIDQLFQNATVSVMSQEHLQPSTSSASTAPPVIVMHKTFHNVYTYSVRKLWIAYGVAIIVTAISAMLELVAVAASGASYSSSNSFSAIFRLARGALMSTDVQSGDLDGKEPLPEHLAKAKIWPEQS